MHSLEKWKIVDDRINAEYNTDWKTASLATRSPSIYPPLVQLRLHDRLSRLDRLIYFSVASRSPRIGSKKTSDQKRGETAGRIKFEF